VSSAPDYPQPISGWRVWLVAEVEGKARLLSVYYHVPWPVRRELVGECLARRGRFRLPGWRAGAEGHATPGERCACGIYAAREPSSAIDYLRTYGTRSVREVEGWPVVHRVLGRVLLWGRLVECEAGWRGARAYPEHLFLPERNWSGRLLERLEDIAFSLANYAIPIEILDGVGCEEELMEALRERAPAA
jgi:hypothetical protein